MNPRRFRVNPTRVWTLRVKEADMATYSHDERRRRRHHEDWLRLCRELAAYIIDAHEDGDHLRYLVGQGPLVMPTAWRGNARYHDRAGGHTVPTDYQGATE